VRIVVVDCKMASESANEPRQGLSTKFRRTRFGSTVESCSWRSRLHTAHFHFEPHKQFLPTGDHSLITVFYVYAGLVTEANATPAASSLPHLPGRLCRRSTSPVPRAPLSVETCKITRINICFVAENLMVGSLICESCSHHFPS
jgi:hypothetical protein